jgi:hypothetical protein
MLNLLLRALVMIVGVCNSPSFELVSFCSDPSEYFA